MDDRTIARWRHDVLGLSRHAFPSAPDVVEGLLGVQAENHAQASWAVACRTAATSADELARLFDEGAILRTHVLRPTWHYVRPDDIRWLVELTAPRIRRSYAQVQAQAGIDDDQLDRACEVIEAALSGGTPRTRGQLGERLTDAGLPGTGQALGLVLSHAELSALVCSGPMLDDEHTWALLDERAPGARRLTREEAVAELVHRYLRGHGPATERDLAYWATMTLTDVRAGLAAVADQLDSVEHDGRTHWFAHPPPDDEVCEPRGHLLQVLDEYHNGYQDSREVLDADGLRPPGRPANVGMALVDAQVVGGMRRTVGPDTVTFEVDAFRPLRDDEHAALTAAATRYGAWLGREPVLAVTG